MSDMPWVRFFPSDWLGGTRGMSAAETGIYITLIATMYERGEPVPEDIPRLARLCGASNSAFRTAVETLVSEGKLIRVDGGLWNERVGKESEIRAEKSEVGRSAANARWAKKSNKNNRGNDADAMRTQCAGNANQKPEARVPESSSSLRSEEVTPPRKKRDGAAGQRKRQERSTKPPAHTLPDWVTKEAWDGYVEMRNRIRAPLTDRAKAIEIKTLDRLRAEGHDPAAVLDQSTQKSWRGLFGLKDDGGGAGLNGHARQPEPGVMSEAEWRIAGKVFLGLTEGSSEPGKWRDAWGPPPPLKCLMPAKLLERLRRHPNYSEACKRLSGGYKRDEAMGILSKTEGMAHG